MSQPFGDNLQCTGTDSSPYKFGKLERDAESGDDHAQHRDYNSNPYRWLTPDPAGEKVVLLTDPQTWNLYMYSHDNPATDNDPTGEQSPEPARRVGDTSPCANAFAQCTLSSGREPCGDKPAPKDLPPPPPPKPPPAPTGFYPSPEPACPPGNKSSN
jgi:RHS repeat-associated protein